MSGCGPALFWGGVIGGISQFHLPQSITSEIANEVEWTPLPGHPENLLVDVFLETEFDSSVTIHEQVGFLPIEGAGRLEPPVDHFPRPPFLPATHPWNWITTVPLVGMLMTADTEYERLKLEWETDFEPKITLLEHNRSIVDDPEFLSKCLENRARVVQLKIDDVKTFKSAAQDVARIARIKNDTSLMVRALSMDCLALLYQENISGFWSGLRLILEQCSAMTKHDPALTGIVAEKSKYITQVFYQLPAHIWEAVFLPTLVELLPRNPRLMTEEQKTILRLLPEDLVSGRSPAPWIRGVTFEDKEAAKSDTVRKREAHFRKIFRAAQEKVYGVKRTPPPGLEDFDFWGRFHEATVHDASVAPHYAYLEAYRAFISGDYYTALMRFVRTLGKGEKFPGMSLDQARVRLGAKASFQFYLESPQYKYDAKMNQSLVWEVGAWLGWPPYADVDGDLPVASVKPKVTPSALLLTAQKSKLP